MIKIIPKPHKLESPPGFFRILPHSKIFIYPFSPKLRATAQFLSEALPTKIPILPGKTIHTNCLHLKLSQEITAAESYQLNINARYILLEAADLAGIFYGIQSLLQMLPTNLTKANSAQLELPVCKISDQPRLKWRGMHLDVSRHFFPISFIKKYLDLLAMHKLNVFHWHLTDDNGWRIEIKKYPRLQAISAWRVDRPGIDWRECKAATAQEAATYGGFYTQEEIREIVDYAAARQILVVPEIEMPGHSVEVLAAYPALGCTGGPYQVPTGVYWPNQDIFCAGKEEVFSFLTDVLNEVIALFPGKYIHIGGDEADKTEWEKCPKCQARMQQENLQNVEELQSWFIRRIEKYLQSKERKLIGWDEILQGGLAERATVMSWRGSSGGIAAAQQGHDVIMCPQSHCYFDHYQADPATQPPAIGGYTPLKKVYAYEPIPSELTAATSHYILGAQANLWTEWIPTQAQAEYMLLPRLSALAEVVWSQPQARNWSDFYQRLQQLRQYFEQSGYNYCQADLNSDQ